MPAPSQFELVQFEESQKEHTSPEALLAVNAILRHNLTAHINDFPPQLREQGEL
jgi:hypothetical protein